MIIITIIIIVTINTVLAIITIIGICLNLTLCWVAYSISSVAETSNGAVRLFSGSGVYEMVSRCLPHQWRFYHDAWRH